jgi:acyl-CoA synthetase (AMP-forming)/AMP-acid ligase II
MVTKTAATTDAKTDDTDTDTVNLLLEQLEENVKKEPSKIVFSWIVNGVDGGSISKSCTYQELQDQTTFLAQRLLFDAGLKRGDRYVTFSAL